MLALGAVFGHAAETVIYYGPAGEILTSGKYTRVTIAWVNGQAVMTQQVVLDIGGGPVPPPPPPPPPVTGIEAKVTALIAGVTDTDKSTTAGKIGEAYTLAATLGELDPNRDAAKIRGSAEAIIGYYLDSKKKAPAWKPFTDGMVALTAPMNALEVIAAYKLTAGLLGGGPVPPPPPPPPPVTTAARAVILIESGDQTATQATLLNQMRNDKSWSKLVTVLDPDQKDENKQPDPQTQSLLQSLSGRPLPRLVLLNSDGAFVGDEPLPAKWDEAKTVLTAKGVKP
jgi:hypothetical protein